jgi:hypothetical protein
MTAATNHSESVENSSESGNFLRKARAVLPLAADVVVPVAGFFVLSAIGLSDTWALTLAGAATGVRTLAGVLYRRRLDGISMLVAVEFLLSAALLVVSDDPRVVLLKPSFYTLVAAGYLLVSVFVGRPVVYEAAAPMATGGDPQRTIAYRTVWDNSAEFRRRERTITAVFAAALALEAGLRAVVVLNTPADEVGQSVLTGQLPGVVLIVAALIFTRSQVPAISRLVDAEQAKLSTAE